jgi:hypothetical protein
LDLRTLEGVNRDIGIVLLFGGLGLAALGLLVWSGALSWFGRLPGDIRIETENSRVFIPIASMIIVSVVLTLCGWILSRWR